MYDMHVSKLGHTRSKLHYSIFFNRSVENNKNKINFNTYDGGIVNKLAIKSALNL